MNLTIETYLSTCLSHTANTMTQQNLTYRVDLYSSTHLKQISAHFLLKLSSAILHCCKVEHIIIFNEGGCFSSGHSKFKFIFYSDSGSYHSIENTLGSKNNDAFLIDAACVKNLFPLFLSLALQPLCLWPTSAILS